MSGVQSINPYAFLSPLYYAEKKGEPSFFDEENVEFIGARASKELAKEFESPVVFESDDIVRVMTRIYEEKVEGVPEMNMRVIMVLCNSYRTHAYTTRKNLELQETQTSSYTAGYNGIAHMTYYDNKLTYRPNRFGVECVGGTLSWRFT